MLFLVFLSVALAALLWERLETVPYSLRAIPIGILILSILFAVYAYGRRREVSELKGLLRGLQHVGAAPSEEQLDQLSQVILRSQRNFKELIDSFDDPACAVSLDGTLRTVNRRIAELTGMTYTELVGRKAYDLIEEPTQADVERGLGRFLEKRRWSGTVRIRLKNSTRPLYFECVLNGIIKGDVNGNIKGPHSKTEVTTPVEILIYVSEGVAATDRLKEPDHDLAVGEVVQRRRRWLDPQAVGDLGGKLGEGPPAEKHQLLLAGRCHSAHLVLLLSPGG